MKGAPRVRHISSHFLGLFQGEGKYTWYEIPYYIGRKESLFLLLVYAHTSHNVLPESEYTSPDRSSCQQSEPNTLLFVTVDG